MAARQDLHALAVRLPLGTSRMSSVVRASDDALISISSIQVPLQKGDGVVDNESERYNISTSF